jgi:staphyloferrin B biosynthesis citrate synthase
MEENQKMKIRANQVKERWNKGEIVISSSIRMPEPGLCEILGYAGFDFVVLDGEHGAIDWSVMDQMIQSCYASNITSVVRVLHNDDSEVIMRALDLGAQGILLPHCRTAEDAKRFKSAASYPPNGKRGYGPGRGTYWGRISQKEYLKQADDSLLLIAIIEDIEGVENIEEIAAAGLDCLWVGTGDLAMDYGVPGEGKHPKLIDASKRILNACLENDIIAGFPVGNPEDAVWAIQQGFRAIGYGGAEEYIMSQSRQFLSALDR